MLCRVEQLRSENHTRSPMRTALSDWPLSKRTVTQRTRLSIGQSTKVRSYQDTGPRTRLTLFYKNCTYYCKWFLQYCITICSIKFSNCYIIVRSTILVSNQFINKQQLERTAISLYTFDVNGGLKLICYRACVMIINIYLLTSEMVKCPLIVL